MRAVWRRSNGAPALFGRLPAMAIHWAASQPVPPSVLSRPVSKGAGREAVARPYSCQTVTVQS
ncbi:hypothetical protein ABZX77_05170 [Streptomyces sp. NPDC004237]|uniref:hypothetical protein n=1 Tax=Streptomyces sp. NPDC004237 TaxID=3154455 RepID=UPI0033B4385E